MLESFSEIFILLLSYVNFEISRYEYRTKAGSIEVTDYTAGDARHWEIKTTIDKTIQLQFEKEVGFEIEYHRRCFYDKLFVYGADRKTRFARICGPKNNQESDIISSLDRVLTN